MSRRTNARATPDADERPRPTSEFTLVPAPEEASRSATESLEPQPDVLAWGDVRVADGALLRGTLSTQGRLEVGTRAVIEGALRAGAGAAIGDGARIAGALEVTGETAWGREASAESATLRGALVMDGLVRARGLTAPAGIHPRARADPGKGAA